MLTLINHLVVNNPMCLEGVRAGRRFLRTGGETGRAVNTTILGIIGVVYLWLLLSILRYHEDVSEVLVLIELAMLTLIVPASLFSAVSGEREKLTWDSLIMTRLTPAQIIAGKLVWRLVLIVGTMALFTVPLLLSQYGLGLWCSGDTCRVGSAIGTFQPHDVMRAQVMVFSWGLLVAALSFFVSTKSRRSVTSLSIITITLLTFLALIPVLVLMFSPRGAIWYAGDTSIAHIFGSYLCEINPFINIDTLQRHVDPSNGRDMWFALGVPHSVPIFYSLAAFSFVIATHKALRGLEVPRRNIG